MSVIFLSETRAKFPVSKSQLVWAVSFLCPNAAPLQLCGFLWFAWGVYWAIAARTVLAVRKSEENAQFLHRIPTIAALLMIFYGGYFPLLAGAPLYAATAPVWLGVLLTFFGLAFCVWARIHLGKYWSGIVALKYDHRLVVTGPYALVRHPIYTGILLATLGSTLASGRPAAFLGFLIMILTYIPKWKREEKIMLEEFGQSYADYMRRTKTIIPYLY